MAEMFAASIAAPRCAKSGGRLLLVVAGLMLAGSASAQQSNGKEQTIAPFGSHMTVQKEDRGVSLDGVLQAIQASKATAQDVKIMTKIDKARIVHLGKALNGAAQKRVEDAVKSHLEDVNALQRALEGNALTYAALNAQSVSTSDIVGAEVSGDRQKSITMFARH